MGVVSNYLSIYIILYLVGQYIATFIVVVIEHIASAICSSGPITQLPPSSSARSRIELKPSLVGMMA